MNQYQEIKILLETKLAELVERVEEIEDDLEAPGDDDWAEGAIESEGDEVLEEVGTLADATIQQIRLALKKIDNGTYGTCTKCRNKIPLERLKALPYATACAKCPEETD